MKGARKKFLPPAKPEMGFGLLFAVVASGENTSGHEKERVVKSESADATFYDEDGDERRGRNIREISSGRRRRKRKRKKTKKKTKKTKRKKRM